MLNKFKGLLSKKAKFDLDNDGKIESYREEIQGLFSQFKLMSDRLQDVNDKLQDVINDEILLQEFEEDNLKRLIEESNKRVEESKQRAEKATQEILINAKRQEKVNDLIL